MENIEVRRINVTDIKQLQKISTQTFYETFSAGNTEDNMRKYLDEGFSIKKLTTELNNEHSVFYFALSENNVVGYLKLNFADSQTELKHNNSVEIERIYVLREYHGKRVGQVLYEKAMQIANECSVNYVWLGVWEENLRAIRFYEKNGFVEFDRHIFRLGNDEQTDIMMKKYL